MRLAISALATAALLLPVAAAAQGADPLRVTTLRVTSTADTAVCIGNAAGASPSSCTGGVVAGKVQTTTIELGSGATDTTLSRVSAGVMAIEGVTVVRNGDAPTLTGANFSGIPDSALSSNVALLDNNETVSGRWTFSASRAADYQIYVVNSSATGYGLNVRGATGTARALSVNNYDDTSELLAVYGNGSVLVRPNAPTNPLLLGGDGTFNWISFNNSTSTTAGVGIRGVNNGTDMYAHVPTSGTFYWRVNNSTAMQLDASSGLSIFGGTPISSSSLLARTNTANSFGSATNTFTNSSVVQSAPFTDTPIKVIGSAGNGTGYAGIAYRTSTTTDNYGWTAGAMRGSDVSIGTFTFNFHDGTSAGTSVLSLHQDGDLGMLAAARHYWDGVGASGDTYTYEESANKLTNVVGGVKTLELTGSQARVLGAEGSAVSLKIEADEGDDVADRFAFTAADSGDFTMTGSSSGSPYTVFTLNGQTWTFNSSVGVIMGVNSYFSTRGRVLASEGNSAQMYMVADDGDDAEDWWAWTTSTDGFFSITNGSPSGTELVRTYSPNNATYTDTGTVTWFLSGAFGTGKSGAGVRVGANTSGSGAPGFVDFLDKSAASHYVWADSTGLLRVNTAKATEATGDTGGVVIGDQTSLRAEKVIHAAFTDYDGALRAMLDAPLWSWSYANGRYNGEHFVGVTLGPGAENANVFGKDGGRAFNDITFAGFTMAAFRAQQAQIDALRAEVAALRGGR